MKTFKILFTLLLFTKMVSLNAQEKVPRFFWATMYDTINVHKVTMEQVHQSMDSIDYTLVSDADFKYLENIMDRFEKKWMAVYGKVPQQFDQASTIFVAGMDCNKCEELIKSEIKNVDGVIDIVKVDRANNEVIFSFVGQPSNEVIDRVIETLNENLMDCGYIIEQYYAKDFDEVKEKVKEAEVLKQEKKNKGCDKH